MTILIGVLGALLVLVILWDAFETIILPRRVTRRLRLARIFYRVTWKTWRAASRLVREGKKRDTFLSVYGPLSLLMLLVVWACAILVGFAMMQWSLGSRLAGGKIGGTFVFDLYFSGSTFFTLGLGDIVPQDTPSRIAAVLEAGLGFGFLAMVIGYLPVIYQAFSRRESEITLMDARAGSPPSAVELLVRQSRSGHFDGAITSCFSAWERWSSDVLESHLSYPVLAYYRSQHDNQSWLGALTTILDASAFVVAAVEGPVTWQAQLTFAMARHAVADLSQTFIRTPKDPPRDRLPHETLQQACEILTAAGVDVKSTESVERKLTELRRLYEPFVNSLSEHLVLRLPQWLPGPKRKENWLTSAWDHAPACEGIHKPRV